MDKGTLIFTINFWLPINEKELVRIMEKLGVEKTISKESAYTIFPGIVVEPRE